MQPRPRRRGAFRLPVKGMVGLSVPALSLGRTLLSEEEDARSQQPENHRGAVDGRERLWSRPDSGDSSRLLRPSARRQRTNRLASRGCGKEEGEEGWAAGAGAGAALASPIVNAAQPFCLLGSPPHLHWTPRPYPQLGRGGRPFSGSACCLDGNISQHHRNSTANVEAPSWAGPLSNLFANAKPKRFRNGHCLQASGCVLEPSIVGARVEELHLSGSLAEVSGSSSCTMFSIWLSCPSDLCFKESFASRCFGFRLRTLHGSRYRYRAH
ncbi:hypothetical protein BDP81DRAFT_159137 [Colletotrichum phormii]|uniref:Uncharacterized protein n=1 Tax=Colletotrichum phormii TaxID=359342 RepID=A0AAI9ZXQ6_9PEZI|nr:uncharacterized protein BDP81DRAFT_159137 [Colletotrichum phormii]KAK1640160.1 hypothetical protein BDP81DRAFT_159137 [Colletotrichum phormii]